MVATFAASSRSVGQAGLSTSWPHTISVMCVSTLIKSSHAVATRVAPPFSLFGHRPDGGSGDAVCGLSNSLLVMSALLGYLTVTMMLVQEPNIQNQSIQKFAGWSPVVRFQGGSSHVFSEFALTFGLASRSRPCTLSLRTHSSHC